MRFIAVNLTLQTCAKFKALERASKMPAPALEGVLVAVWKEAANDEDGLGRLPENFGDDELRCITEGLNPPAGMFRLLCEKRWLDRNGDRWAAHDWLDHQPYFKTRIQNRAKQEAFRKRKKPPTEEPKPEPVQEREPAQPRATEAEVTVTQPEVTDEGTKEVSKKASKKKEKKEPTTSEPFVVHPELAPHEYYAEDRKLNEKWPKLREAIAKSCPGVNIVMCIAKSHGWLLTMPKGHRSDFPRFLRNWCEKNWRDIQDGRERPYIQPNQAPLFGTANEVTEPELDRMAKIRGRGR